jgi:hypothetical protein
MESRDGAERGGRWEAGKGGERRVDIRRAPFYNGAISRQENRTTGQEKGKAIYLVLTFVR